MNEIVNHFLLAGDKFIPEVYWRQPWFTYSACGTFTRNKERIQKFKETGDSQYIYQNELDKVCFQDDTAYGDFKYLTRRATSDKILRNNVLNVAKTQNMRDIKGVLFQCFILFLMSNQGLAE